MYRGKELILIVLYVKDIPRSLATIHGALYGGPTNKMSKDKSNMFIFLFFNIPALFSFWIATNALEPVFIFFFLIPILFIHYNVARKMFLKFQDDHNLIMLNSTSRIQSRIFKLAHKSFINGASLYSIPPHVFSAVAMLSSLQISMPTMLSHGSIPQNVLYHI